MDDDPERLISKLHRLHDKIELTLNTAFPQSDTPVQAATVLQLKAANENTSSTLRDLADLRERLTQQTVTDAQLNEYKSTYATQLEATMKIDAEKTSQIAGLRETLQKLSRENAARQQTASEDIGSLKAKNSEHAECIARLKNHLDQANASVQEKDKALEKAGADIEELQRSCDSQVNEAQSRKDARFTEILVDYDNKIARFENDLKQANILLQERGSALEKANTEKKDLRVKCDTRVLELQRRSDARVAEILTNRDSKIVQLENDLNHANALVQKTNGALETANAEKRRVKDECNARVNEAQRRSDARIQELLAERDQAIAERDQAITELETSRTKIRDEFQRKLVAKVAKFKERNDDMQQRAVEAVYESETTVVDLVRRQERELASKDEAMEALRHSQECALNRVRQLEVFNQRLNALLDKAIAADGHAKAWTNELKAVAKQETKNSCQLKNLLARQKEKNNQLQDALNESLRTNVRLGERLEDAGAEFYQASAAQVEQHQKQLTQLQDEHDSLSALRDNELEQKIQSALAQNNQERDQAHRRQVEERDEAHRRENTERDQRFKALEQMVTARLRTPTPVLPSSGRSRFASRRVSPDTQGITPGAIRHTEQAFGRADSTQVTPHISRELDKLPAFPVSTQHMLPPRPRREASLEFPESTPIRRRSSMGLLYGIHDHVGQHDAYQGDLDTTLVDYTNFNSIDSEESSSDVEAHLHIEETPRAPRRHTSKRPAEDELTSTVKLRRQTTMSTPALDPIPTSATNGQANSSARRALFPYDERVRRADHIWDLMHKDWSITSDEETKLREQLASLFSRGKAIHKVKEAIDKHVVGSFRERQVTPRPCLLANLTGENGGKGGSMTSGSCPYCKNKSHRVCVWAEYAPGVASGFGERNEAGIITDQVWDPTPSPSTFNIGGQQVRWYLRKRRDPVSRG
ncbi:hypothetical protein LTR70_005735 [Exophiala xenobiotica]|uniref:Uncharacterized protein n=1 Tax=Lithohypha guttulata TaxID=1690604 RepID=A0ABR0K8Q6_9EURO|nr:hypothetical protein LTR24_005472 [Lithohypha guttulata]KAK5317629.1 hypothetical protein LTR70_005735 [Exophiala xenobiotica]